MNHGLLWGRVAYYFGVLGVAGSSPNYGLLALQVITKTMT